MKRPLTRIHKIDEAELNLLKKRIDIASAVVIFLVALLVVRLWYLQIHLGAKYAKMSENNRIRVEDLVAPRGNILDRRGRLMVTNRPCFNVVWDKEDSPNPDEVLKRLAKILGVEVTTLLDRIRSASGRPRYLPLRLQEDIDWKTLVYIENHRFELPGVHIEVLPRRDYLFGDLASHLIGYLGEINERELEDQTDGHYQGGDQIGKMGIEKVYEPYLRGEKGRKYLEVDSHGFEQKQLRVQEPLPGDDLHLTIDLDLQYAAEQALAGKAGAVVAMEVNTGRLLVLASSPPLPLEEFIGGISTPEWQKLLNNPLHPLIDKTIQGQYPPGSTYKIVTALAGLAEKAITPKTILYCPGYFQLGNRRYHCWKRSGHGAVDLQKALAQSCDVYFYQVGLKLGVDTLAKYAFSLGLGRKTGINLEHEKAGLIPTSAWKKSRYGIPWQEGETLSVAIGQGFDLVTPLQLCRLTAALANGGILYRPQFIEAIKGPDGKILKQFQPVVEGKALGKPWMFSVIRDGLVAAVNDPHGTGGKARLPNVIVGGKTGTAQVIRLDKFKDMPEKDLPYKYRDHAWFTCFAPAANPKIAVTVLVEHGNHGGSAAAPIAKKVLERYFETRPALTAPSHPAHKGI